MTTKLSIAAIAVCLFASCQRGLDYTLESIRAKPNYHASFKVNSQPKNYSGTLLASFTAVDSMFNCSVLMADSSNGERVQVNLFDTRAITAQTKYTDQMIKGKPQAVITYTDNSGKQYSSAVTVAPAYVTIMITEDATDHVSGTFSGILQNADDVASGNTSNAIAITQGVFIVRK